jgi:hypothetical protein
MSLSSCDNECKKNNITSVEIMLNKLSYFSKIIASIEETIFVEGITKNTMDRIKYLEKQFVKYNKKFDDDNETSSDIFMLDDAKYYNDNISDCNNNISDNNDNITDYIKYDEIENDDFYAYNDENDNDDNIDINKLYDTDDESCHLDIDETKEKKQLEEIEFIMNKIKEEKNYTLIKERNYVIIE